MVRYVKIHNFRSIRDLTLDLTFAEKKAPNGWRGYEMMPFVTQEKSPDFRQTPILALYGANASGKSNVLKALAALDDLLTRGVYGVYDPNRLNPVEDAKASFIVEIIKNNRQYLYTIEYNADSILLEKLVRIDKEGESLLFSIEQDKPDFNRLPTENVYTEDKLFEIYNVECVDVERKVQVKSFLHTLFKGFPGLSEELTGVAETLIKDSVIAESNKFSLYRAIRSLAGGKEQEKIDAASARVVKILQNFDFTIQSIAFEEARGNLSDLLPHRTSLLLMPDDEEILNENSNSWVKRTAIITHRGVDGRMESFKLADESEGTKIAASLIALCLSVLDHGRTLFIDELDRSLHPLILTALVRLFKRKETNPHGAQLVFTLHDTIILENPETRVSEIGIINNNPYTGTTLLRLSDIRDGKEQLRNVNNFRKQYLEGLYSGIPYPELD